MLISYASFESSDPFSAGKTFNMAALEFHNVTRVPKRVRVKLLGLSAIKRFYLNKTRGLANSILTKQVFLILILCKKNSGK